MGVPPLIAEALAVDSGWLPGEPALGRTCVGAKHHSPSPLVLHRVALDSGREVMLCGTCQDNVAVLRGLMAQADGPLSWPLRREFGNLVRALAEER